MRPSSAARTVGPEIGQPLHGSPTARTTASTYSSISPEPERVGTAWRSLPYPADSECQRDVVVIERHDDLSRLEELGVMDVSRVGEYATALVNGLEVDPDVAL